MSTSGQKLHCRVGGEEYVLRRDGDELVIGQQRGGDVVWLDQRVDIDRLEPRAREALDAGDVENQSLGIAIQGIVSAAAERGG